LVAHTEYGCWRSTSSNFFDAASYWPFSIESVASL